MAVTIQKNADAAAVKQHFMSVCPSCGKTVHISRNYCNCHARLYRQTVILSEKQPDIGPCNFESPGLTCNDCPENCKWCASFGSSGMNNQGFGGKDCRYNDGSVRCFCCQAQVKIATDLGKADFSGLFTEAMKKQKPEGEGGKNILHQSSDFISEEMKKPVLNRINHYKEQAV
jgi:hypothetical protein